MVLVQQAGRRTARPQPDLARAIGMAGAIALNVALFMLLLVPMTAPVLPKLEIDDTIWVPLEKVKQPDPPPVVKVERQVKPTAAVPTRELVAPVVQDVPIVDSDSTPMSMPYTSPVGDPVPFEEPTPPGPATGMSLQYANAPAPRYPIEAMKQGLQGVVMLEILVGTNGKPIKVTLHKSSGHRILDEEARRHVLKRWTFRPAMKDGQAVQAIGIVPIDFALDRG